ncbi:hypothetical protein NQ314_000085 [Rhamnusium bicolor]|uniref:Uncharacterized protein n=1 Tax=Rhamnusium bicolor TaxID=1586634 RepID=A0AAV8ZX72_9CUCU|nr:hypothetical protein NQ314_000085 [Rhamnusium bicolor]
MSDSEEESIEKHLKLVFVGEPNVGKTSIIRRFCYDEFTRQYNQTVGADFYIKRLALPGRKDISVRITDIGGLELNGHMLENYLFNSNVCDLEHKRAVRLDKTQRFVGEFGLFNFLVSAKTGENVNTCLTDLIARHFGIPLSRIEREKQATVIKAELTPTTPEQIKNNPIPSNSSVCCIQ